MIKLDLITKILLETSSNHIKEKFKGKSISIIFLNANNSKLKFSGNIKELIKKLENRYPSYLTYIEKNIYSLYKKEFGKNKAKNPQEFIQSLKLAEIVLSSDDGEHQLVFDSSLLLGNIIILSLNKMLDPILVKIAG
jgi:hypothetical protein